MEENVNPKKRGRPAAFDYDHALHLAMRAFWQYGYEGTSMSTLMAAMQMNKASIYAAYGSKEVLFQTAIEQYVQGPASFVSIALEQPTIIAVIRHLLTGAAKMMTEDQDLAGCLVTKGALTGSVESKDMQALLSDYRKVSEQRFRHRFEQAKVEHDLPEAIDTMALAKLVMTIHQGMTVQAISGVEQSELLTMAEMAVQMIEKSYVITQEGV